MRLKPKNTYRFALVFLLVLIVLNLLPVLVLAQPAVEDTTAPFGSGLIPCGNDEGGPGDCDWEDLVTLAQRVVDFILLKLMIPLAVIALVYAGIQVIRGKTQPAELIKAKGALYNVAVGIFLALGAYAIIKTILTLLPGNTEFMPQVIQQVFGS